MSRRKRRTAYRFGLRGETRCVWWLRCKGYRILARGYRLPIGEIDIVARRGRTVAFVEVKARATATAASAALTPRQRRRIERAAAGFLAANPHLSRQHVRFDVMYVVPGRLPIHIRDAWRPGT
jgi:putative endonuclease